MFQCGYAQQCYDDDDHGCSYDDGGVHDHVHDDDDGGYGRDRSVRDHYDDGVQDSYDGDDDYDDHDDGDYRNHVHDRGRGHINGGGGRHGDDARDDDGDDADGGGSDAGRSGNGAIRDRRYPIRHKTGSNSPNPYRHLLPEYRKPGGSCKLGKYQPTT